MPDYAAIAALAASRSHKRNALAAARAAHNAKHSTAPSSESACQRNARVQADTTVAQHMRDARDTHYAYATPTYREPR